jgi:hypothetical protein
LIYTYPKDGRLSSISIYTILDPYGASLIESLWTVYRYMSGEVHSIRNFWWLKIVCHENFEKWVLYRGRIQWAVWRGQPIVRLNTSLFSSSILNNVWDFHFEEPQQISCLPLIWKLISMTYLLYYRLSRNWVSIITNKRTLRSKVIQFVLSFVKY